MGRLVPHTHAPRGKRIRVKLKDGTVFIDKFLEHTGKRMIFETRTERPGDIDSFSIYRPHT